MNDRILDKLLGKTTSGTKQQQKSDCMDKYDWFNGTQHRTIWKHCTDWKELVQNKLNDNFTITNETLDSVMMIKN